MRARAGRPGAPAGLRRRFTWVPALLVGFTACSQEPCPTIVFDDTSAQVDQVLAERSPESSPPSAPDPQAAEARLELEPMSVEIAQKFFGGVDVPGTRKVYDPDCYFFGPPNLRSKQEWPEHPAGSFPVVTNSLGMREDAEPSAKKPDLRILVTGDSHTDGVCSNAESFPNLLEERLRAAEPGRSVEVLNAGRGAIAFHNYLGVYQKFRYLEPDVFIVAVYLGNDFREDLRLDAWNSRRRMPAATQTMLDFQKKAVEESAEAYGQSFMQLAWFHELPETMPVAAESARRVMHEIALRCMEDGVQFIVVFIPAPTNVEWNNHQVKFQRLLDICHLERADLEIHDRLADGLAASLAGTPIVDGRTLFLPAEAPHYWLTDKHLNLKGHRALAEALVPVVEAVLGE